MQIKASDLFVKALENEGVEYIFGVPGEENLDLLQSLRGSRIQLVLTRHEQGAAFMAATYGRLTGQVGCCLATLGPGATNFVTPAAYAQLGGMPLLMITGQKPIKKSKQGRFQIIDVVSTFSSITKYAKQIVNVHTIPSVVREAFRLATEERPGAVLLELPEDVAAETTDESEINLLLPNNPRRPVCDDKSIEQALELLQRARMPLLLVGAGANRKRVMRELTHFVQVTGIPFFNTQMGKGVVQNCPDKYLGTAALSSGDYVHCAIDRADLIINVGHDVVEKPPFFMSKNGVNVIHINFFSAQVDDVYFPQIELVGDIGSTMERLSAGYADYQCQHDFSYFERVRTQVQAHMKEGVDDPSFPVKPQRLVAAVRAVMPEQGVIALDNGMYKIWFARNYRTHVANTVLLDNALATMGAGLPSAMMAAMLQPDNRVMAICGDGGFMMNSQELETAVRLGLNLVVLIINDGAYGMIRWKQSHGGFDDWGLSFNNPDFVVYAQAYGATGHRLEKTEQLEATLEAAFQAGGVHLVDVPVDYSENQRVLIEELAKRVCIL